MWQLTLAVSTQAWLITKTSAFLTFHINPESSQNLCYGIKYIEYNHLKHVTQSCPLNKKNFDCYYDASTGLVSTKKGRFCLQISNGIFAEASDCVYSNIRQLWDLVAVEESEFVFKSRNDMVLEAGTSPRCMEMVVRADDRKFVAEVRQCGSDGFSDSLDIDLTEEDELSDEDRKVHGWTSDEHELKGFSNAFKALISRYKG